MHSSPSSNLVEVFPYSLVSLTRGSHASEPRRIPPTELETRSVGPTLARRPCARSTGPSFHCPTPAPPVIARWFMDRVLPPRPSSLLLSLAPTRRSPSARAARGRRRTKPTPHPVLPGRSHLDGIRAISTP
ncbi:hypothetical protein U9M48_043515 [Paspalum notatum var. saurae]|uniref:Uncharacterized protein n=1 Tax=Paspalum notatum var. saurae TaxID=547442 RepID=A0AAQ3UX24_PASNO